MPIRVVYKSIERKPRNKPTSCGKEAKCQTKIQSSNSIITTTNFVEYISNAKQRWPGHGAWMADNRWTIRSTE